MNYARLCIVTAVDVEFDAAARLLASPPRAEENGLQVCRGRRGDRRVTLLKTGMGARGFAPRLRAHLAADPADAVLVAGLAGALAPDLAAGDLVLYDRCLDARNERELAPGRDEIASIVMDDALPDILAALFHTAGQRVRVAPGITVGEVLVTAQAKLALGARHRAAAVDMETFEIAVACREQGIPFAALRVVSDEAGQDLPDFNRAYDAAGRVLPAQMAAALLARPAVTARFLRQLRPVMRSFRNALTVALDAPLV